MGSSEEAWGDAASNRNAVGAKLQIVVRVPWASQMQPTMVVAMAADLVPFFGDSSHKIWPPLGMLPENEERRAHVGARERVEHSWCRVRIWSIVESECQSTIACGQSTQRGSEDPRVAMECAVGQGRRSDSGQRRSRKHDVHATGTLGPMRVTPGSMGALKAEDRLVMAETHSSRSTATDDDFGQDLLREHLKNTPR